MTRLRVGVAGLGAIGGPLAQRLARGDILGVELVAAAGRNLAASRARLAGLGLSQALSMELCDLPTSCDLVVEAAPAACFRAIAAPVLAAGRTLVALSAGALLQNEDLLEAPGVVLVPSGAVGGLDVVRAASADGGVDFLKLITRKPLASLFDVPYLATRRIELLSSSGATLVFHGDARAAGRAFPANANVAACLALAGPGPERTEVEIWADTEAVSNSHCIEMRSAAACMTLRIESDPSPDNPRTSRLALASVLALLRRQASGLQIGS